MIGTVPHSPRTRLTQFFQCFRFKFAVFKRRPTWSRETFKQTLWSIDQWLRRSRTNPMNYIYVSYGSSVTLLVWSAADNVAGSSFQSVFGRVLQAIVLWSENLRDGYNSQRQR